MCLVQKEGQSAIETVGHQWAWMVFPYKTDPKKQRYYREDICLGLNYRNLQQTSRTGLYKGSPITYNKCQAKFINGQP